MEKKTSVNMDNKIRLDWVDIARGIGIVLVCMQHRFLPDFIGKWICSFHMPFFFLLSGFLTKFEKYSSGVEYAKRKIKGLIIPYFSLGVIYIVLEYLYSIMMKTDFSLMRWLENLIVGRAVGSSWFIIALFFVEIIAWFIHLVSEKISFLIVVSITVIGFIINAYVDRLLFWDVNAVMIGIFFFEVGILLRRYDLISKIHRVVVILPFLMLSIICTFFNGDVSMYYCNYSNPVLFIIGAISGSLIVFWIAIRLKNISGLKLIKYFGKNTLPIIEFHRFPIYVILESVSYRLLHIIYGSNSSLYILESVLYAIIACAICMIPSEIINRWIPWMGGKQKKC